MGTKLWRGCVVRESTILHRCLLALSEAGHLAWRCNTGQGWTGQSIHAATTMHVTMQPGDVLIRNARPLRAGLCVGGSDIVGIGPGGRFYGVETKTKTGKLTPEQKSFGDAVVRAGGIYGVARSEDEVVGILKASPG